MNKRYTILLVLGICALCVSSFLQESSSTTTTTSENARTSENLRTAGYTYDLRGTGIIICDFSPSYTWSETKAHNAWLTGEGTQPQPYVIESVIAESITIDTSDKYFIIRNCNFLGKIDLYYVTNGKVINNNFNMTYGVVLTGSDYNNISCNIFEESYITVQGKSENNIISRNTLVHVPYERSGIYLEASSYDCHNNIISNNVINGGYANYGIYLGFGCENNTVYNNTVINHGQYGIDLYSNKYNNISNNILDDLIFYGIRVENCNYTTVSNNSISNCGVTWQKNCGMLLKNGRYNNVTKNTMSKCGIFLEGTVEEMISNKIDSSNVVNTKPVYYYFNKINLGTGNFTNPGQIILVNCSNSSVSGFSISWGSRGISLQYCKNVTINNNILSYHKEHGAYLYKSNNTKVLSNSFIQNQSPQLYESGCIGTIKENNYFEEIPSGGGGGGGGSGSGSGSGSSSGSGDSSDDNDDNSGGESTPELGIPGYDLWIVVSIICTIAVIILKKVRFNVILTEIEEG